MEKTRETAHILDQLYVTLDQRKGADPETSYTAKLFRKGTHKIAQKVGEEAVETLIEAVRGKPDRLVSESADLLYHLLVLWADAKVKPERVWVELARRESIPGFAHIAAENEETN